MKQAVQVFFASEWFFVTAVAAFRLAILCLYLELFRGSWFRWCCKVTIAIVVLYWVASILTIALLCRPINANWNITVHRTCGDVAKTEYASAGFNLAVDLVVVTLPMPIVWSLQMPKEKKVTVTAAFLLGLVTAGVNIGRIMQTKLCDQSNTTYCALDASILIQAEISCGILVSCAPTLGPIFQRRARTYNPPERNGRHGLRTFGSSGRSWPRRKLQVDTTLLGSVDDVFELPKNGTHTHQTQVVSPGGCHQTNPGEIRVQSEMSVSQSAAGEWSGVA
ncbi:hypothetical protein BO78DRAFT_323449 [Aspergillus sclerotiicarbonarius CBS 121057]|uniref:Rhodopsin domain-containing protein n=1 Tax=Aspergillus sclerotiicarbonarius (strain CBS 121057 / IBT 28362) TaxID=1448318 RepID=A0A319DZA3_ASPSB|nr:hypothetical protein BO78DRAFT_323449 [Aspergillus sclerotiicarbonarius CBS 121057]